MSCHVVFCVYYTLLLTLFLIHYFLLRLLTVLRLPFFLDLFWWCEGVIYNQTIMSRNWIGLTIFDRFAFGSRACSLFLFFFLFLFSLPLPSFAGFVNHLSLFPPPHLSPPPSLHITPSRNRDCSFRGVFFPLLSIPNSPYPPKITAVTIYHSIHFFFFPFHTLGARVWKKRKKITPGPDNNAWFLEDAAVWWWR